MLSRAARIALLIAFLIGCARAIDRAWLCDDSFISFRYARNLVEGKGLVYNEGERVEGYTNLLWTLLIAGALKGGVEPEPASKTGGILCWLALAAVLAVHAARRRRLPFAAAAVLLMDDWQTWATGGLETSLFALLSAAGVLLADGPGSARRAALAGLLLALAVATRPDGVLFAAVGVLACALAHRAYLIALLAPLVAGGAALVAFKLAYYGELLPTAFHSKSALRPYYGQGLIYAALFVQKNWFLVPLAAAAAVAGRAPRESRAPVAACLLFGLYVIHSGGDFMFARRLLPAVPFLLVALEEMLAAIPHEAVRGGLYALGLLGACLPCNVFAGADDRIFGIANEPAFYPREYVEMRKAQAHAAAQALAGAPVRTMFEGGMCMFGYYSRLPYLVEATGLTQYTLARRPLLARGLVGHEKGPDDAWLTENRIHLVFLQAPPPILPGEPRHANTVHFGGVLRATVWIYEDAVMDRLRGNPDVRFTPIEHTLRAAERKIERLPEPEAARMRAFLARFYLDSARTGGP